MVARKSNALTFGSKVNKQLVKDNLKPIVANNVITFVENVQNLGLMMDDSLWFRVPVESIVVGALRMLYPHRFYSPIYNKKISV